MYTIDYLENIYISKLVINDVNIIYSFGLE